MITLVPIGKIHLIVYSFYQAPSTYREYDFLPSRIASTLHESDKDSSAGHLLLFISALIPKALSSILTSTVIELSKPEHVRLMLGWVDLTCTGDGVCIYNLCHSEQLYLLAKITYHCPGGLNPLPTS